MSWHPLIAVQIKHDYFDLVSLGFNLLLGIVAIASLWISRKALKKSEFDSAMSTSPSIVVRPKQLWVGIRDSEISHGYGVERSGSIISKKNIYEIIFQIEFECFNAGRGVAFNISKPNVSGLSLSDFRENKTPLYLTQNDEAFEISIMKKGKFEEFYSNTEKEIPVIVYLVYTNDQNNIFCKSTWKANIKPFDRDGENLKVRDIRVLQRSGKIEYAQKPYEN